MRRPEAPGPPEVFLSRDLFRRRRDGKPIDPGFLKLHYPRYWHYDILGGLVAMAELESAVRSAL